MLKVKKPREKVENVDHHLKWIVKSGFFVFLAIIFSKIITYVYRVIIARHYGPEAYGLFSLGVMTIGWFVAFASLGLSEGILRYIALYRGKNKIEEIKYIINTALTIQLITSIIASIILFFSANFISTKIFHDVNLTIFLKIFSLAIPFTILAGLFLSVIRAYEKIQWYSFIVNILQNLVAILSIIALIFIGVKADAIAISYTLGIFGMLIVSYLICKYKIPGIFDKHKIKDKTIIKEVFHYSWPLIFLGILGSMLTWVDTFMIGTFRTIVEVGLYNVATPIAGLLYIVPDLFLQIFFPLVTKEYSQNKISTVKQITQQVTKWILLINIPLFLMMFIFPGAIINILFGKQYLGAENALRIIIIGTLFISTAGISNSLLSMVGKSKLIFKNILIVTILNIILNFYFISKWGIIGAAITNVISWILFAIITFYQAKKYTTIVPIKKDIIKVVIIAIIPTVFLVYIRKLIAINTTNIIFLGSIFLLIYIVLIITTKCLDKNDMMILKAIKRKIFG